MRARAERGRERRQRETSDREKTWRPLAVALSLLCRKRSLYWRQTAEEQKRSDKIQRHWFSGEAEEVPRKKERERKKERDGARSAVLCSFAHRRRSRVRRQKRKVVERERRAKGRSFLGWVKRTSGRERSKEERERPVFPRLLCLPFSSLFGTESRGD